MVSSEVPEGASRFLSWWSSMTSAPATQGAHSSAQRIMRAAPMEKFAATTRCALPENQPRMASRSASSKPVVPQTTCTPCCGAPGEVVPGRRSDGEVDGHLGPGLCERRRARPAISRPLPRTPATSSRWRPAAAGSTAATSSRSAALEQRPRRPPSPSARRRRRRATLITRSPTRRTARRRPGCAGPPAPARRRPAPGRP